MPRAPGGELRRRPSPPRARALPPARPPGPAAQPGNESPPEVTPRGRRALPAATQARQLLVLLLLPRMDTDFNRGNGIAGPCRVGGSGGGQRCAVLERPDPAGHPGKGSLSQPARRFFLDYNSQDALRRRHCGAAGLLCLLAYLLAAQVLLGGVGFLMGVILNTAAKESDRALGFGGGGESSLLLGPPCCCCCCC